MPNEIEFYEAQIEAARNGQTAAMAQAEAWKTTAEHYRGQAETAKNRYRTLVISVIIWSPIAFLLGALIY